MEWTGLNKDARGERLMGGVAAQTWYLSCLLLRLVLVRVDLCVEKCDRDSVRSRAREGPCERRLAGLAYHLMTGSLAQITGPNPLGEGIVFRAPAQAKGWRGVSSSTLIITCLWHT